MVYGPNGIRGEKKRPLASLTTVLVKPVSMLVMVMETPGSVAPVSSCVNPWMTPVVAWDWA